MTIDTTLPAESDLETIDINVNVGPQHPATHGVFRMILTVDGELVVDLDPVIGYMHRGNEKLPENCDYRQVIGYHDRTDYLAQFNTEHCYVEAVEKLAGLMPPERAEYIRVILAEMNRLASHLMFFGAFGTDIGLFGTSFMYAFRDRETIQDFFEEITGERMMYNYFRPGGVAWDVTEDFRPRCQQVIAEVKRGIDQLDALMMENEPRPQPGQPGRRDQLGAQRPDAAGNRPETRHPADGAVFDLQPFSVRRSDGHSGRRL